MRWCAMERPDRHPHADAIVATARRLVGMRFRPQGRGPDGYDCLGVVIAAAAGGGVPLAAPCDYDLGSLDFDRLLVGLCAAGCSRRAPWAAADGDILLARPGVRQAHLAVRIPSGLVEAHASLRRVVERPIAPGETWAMAWRLPRIGGHGWER